MRTFFFALFIAVAPAQASTWQDVGTEMLMTPEMVDRLKASSRCAGDGGYDGVVSVYQHFTQETGVTVFALYDDGQIMALRDMLGERFSLDYCS